MPFARAPASRHPTGKYRKSSRTLAGRPVVSFKLLTRRMVGGQQCTSPSLNHSLTPSTTMGPRPKRVKTFRTRCISLGDPPPDLHPQQPSCEFAFCQHTHTIILIYTNADFSIENRTIIDLYVGGWARSAVEQVIILRRCIYISYQHCSWINPRLNPAA